MSAHRPVIVRAASKFAIPLLFVFAAHLAVDGAGAPGGGFAAAGAFVLVVFGQASRTLVSPNFTLIHSALSAAAR